MVSCSMKDKDYNGNCEGCNNRMYCMMSEIIERLHLLETKVARTEAPEVG